MWPVLYAKIMVWSGCNREVFPSKLELSHDDCMARCFMVDGLFTTDLLHLDSITSRILL